MNYEVKSNLEVKCNSWQEVKIYECGFTNSGTLRYNVVRTSDMRNIAKIFIDGNKKVVRVYQGKNRFLKFHYSPGIDSDRPDYLIEKVLNFIMW